VEKGGDIIAPPEERGRKGSKANAPELIKPDVIVRARHHATQGGWGSAADEETKSVQVPGGSRKQALKASLKRGSVREAVTRPPRKESLNRVMEPETLCDKI